MTPVMTQVTTTTDGRTFVAYFDDRSTAAVEHVVIDSNGKTMHRWGTRPVRVKKGKR